MRTLAPEALAARLRDGDDLEVVAVLSPDGFRRARIPGSIRFRTLEEALRTLPREREIVLYCTGFPCIGSSWAYRLLEERGYRQLWLLSGGLQAWSAADLPLERAGPE